MFWSQSARCKPSQGLGAATALLCGASRLGPSQCAGKGLLANVRDAAEQLELFCITLSSDKTLTEPVLPGETRLITPAQNRHLSSVLCVDVSRICSCFLNLFLTGAIFLCTWFGVSQLPSLNAAT